MIVSDTKEIRAFWEGCRTKHGIVQANYHVSTLVDPECLDPNVPTLDLSDQPKLILAHQKRGTAHMAMDFEINNIPRRVTGDYWVILDPSENPIGLVRVTDVYESTFLSVPVSFSVQEGEGDMSLRFWREAHRDYFVLQCEKIGIKWDESCVVVCESFELIEPFSVSATEELD